MKKLATMALGFGIGAACTLTAWCLGCFQGAELMVRGTEAIKAEVKNTVDETERVFANSINR